MKILRILGALLLVCIASTAEARQRHRVAMCVETGSVMQPVCGMTGASPAMTRADRREARRVARGRYIADHLGIGGVTPREEVRRRRNRSSSRGGPIRQAVSHGSGVVRAVSGATAHVAASATGAFQCLVNALEGQGYRIKFMGGWRAHGSVRGSLHPAGLALDVNQVARGVTTPPMPSNEIALANGCGLISGAQWANNDSGHFQLGGWAGNGRRHYARRHHRHRHYAAR